MNKPIKNQNLSNKVVAVTLTVLLALIIIDSFVNPAAHSFAVRSLALAILLLASITMRKP